MSTFDAIKAGVSWAHKKMGFPSPTDHTLVKQLISSAHRMLSCLAVNRKLSLRSHLKLLIEKYKFASLDFLQIPTLIALGFVGFLRWDDLISFNISDLSFHNNHFNQLFFRKSIKQPVLGRFMDIRTQKWFYLLPCKSGEKVFSFGWC